MATARPGTVGLAQGPAGERRRTARPAGGRGAFHPRNRRSVPGRLATGVARKQRMGVRAELLDLLRWAGGFSLDATFDLGRAVLVAAAHLQQGSELRFLWFSACEEAAIPRLRHRLGAALLGLAKAPGGPGGGPSHDLIVGLARWAVRLPDCDYSRGEAVRE